MFVTLGKISDSQGFIAHDPPSSNPLNGVR